MKQTFIGEVKIFSPFGFKSRHSWDTLFGIANAKADFVSIHTSSRWKGAMEDLLVARRSTNKPILAKGIHESDDDIKRCLDYGADYVLVVGRVPPDKFIQKCLVEPTSLQQLKDIGKDLDIVVWNSRDLQTGGLKSDKWEEVVSLCKRVIQASNIKTRADVHSDAYGFIVGENLPIFI